MCHPRRIEKEAPKHRVTEQYQPGQAYASLTGAFDRGFPGPSSQEKRGRDSRDNEHKPNPVGMGKKLFRGEADDPNDAPDDEHRRH